MSKLVSFLSLSLMMIPASAQSAEMADGMRAEGKIYVLVAIVLTILLGLFAYLIRLDRKLAKLEKEHPAKRP